MSTTVDKYNSKLYSPPNILGMLRIIEDEVHRLQLKLQEKEELIEAYKNTIHDLKTDAAKKEQQLLREVNFRTVRIPSLEREIHLLKEKLHEAGIRKKGST